MPTQTGAYGRYINGRPVIEGTFGTSTQAALAGPTGLLAAESANFFPLGPTGAPGAEGSLGSGPGADSGGGGLQIDPRQALSEILSAVPPDQHEQVVNGIESVSRATGISIGEVLESIVIIGGVSAILSKAIPQKFMEQAQQSGGLSVPFGQLPFGAPQTSPGPDGSSPGDDDVENFGEFEPLSDPLGTFSSALIGEPFSTPTEPSSLTSPHGSLANTLAQAALSFSPALPGIPGIAGLVAGLANTVLGAFGLPGVPTSAKSLIGMALSTPLAQALGLGPAQRGPQWAEMLGRIAPFVAAIPVVGPFIAMGLKATQLAARAIAPQSLLQIIDQHLVDRGIPLQMPSAPPAGLENLLGEPEQLSGPPPEPDPTSFGLGIEGTVGGQEMGFSSALGSLGGPTMAGFDEPVSGTIGSNIGPETDFGFNQNDLATPADIDAGPSSFGSADFSDFSGFSSGDFSDSGFGSGDFGDSGDFSGSDDSSEDSSSSDDSSDSSSDSSGSDDSGDDGDGGGDE